MMLLRVPLGLVPLAYRNPGVLGREADLDGAEGRERAVEEGIAVLPGPPEERDLAEEGQDRRVP